MVIITNTCPRLADTAKDTWDVPQIRNYVFAVDEIMTEVPDTKEQIKEIVNMLVTWIKDHPIGRHMDNYQRLVTGGSKGVLKDEEGDEEEPDAEEEYADPFAPQLTIRSMEESEAFTSAMLRLMLASVEDGVVERQEEMIDKNIVKENVPSRINTLLEVCGIFENSFWKEYMTAWLEEGGVSGVNEPPLSIQLLLTITEQLIYTSPKHAVAFKGMEHPMHVALLKQLHNYNVLMETEPGLLRQGDGGAPRSVMAALMIRTVGALCQCKDYFYDITAIEKREEQLTVSDMPGVDISIRTIYEIFRSSIASCDDADVLQSLYTLFNRLLQMCDKVEKDMMDERERELMKKGQGKFAKDAVGREEERRSPLDGRTTLDGKEITFVKMNIRQVDNKEKQPTAYTLLKAESSLNPPDTYIAVGRYFNIFSREPDSGDIVYDLPDIDKHIINACRVRWAITCQIFELDADQGKSFTAKMEREEQMAEASKEKAKERLQNRANASKVTKLACGRQVPSDFFDNAVVEMYNPMAERLLYILTGSSELYINDEQNQDKGMMHPDYEKLATEAKRISLESKKWQVKRAVSDANAKIDVLGKEGVEAMKERAEQLSTDEAILHDSRLPEIKEQRNQTMCELIDSVLGIISYYLVLSKDHLAALTDSMALQDPYVLVQRALRYPTRDEDAADLEDVLFECLNCPNDDVKVSAVECLAGIRTDKLKAEDIAKMVKVVTECQSVSEGRMEDVIGGVLKNLEKIGNLVYTHRDPETHQNARDFHRIHGEKLIERALDTLVQMSQRDTQYLSPTEVIEKSSLCHICVSFLRSACSWNQRLADFAISDLPFSRVREVFHYEEKWGDPLRPIRIEDTSCVSYSVTHAMKFLRPAQKTSFINTRLLHQIACMLEGEAHRELDLVAKMDRDEDVQRRHEMSMVVPNASGKMNLDNLDLSGSNAGGLVRFHEEDYHTEVYKKLYPLGGDEECEKPGTGGKFTTYQQTPQQRLDLTLMYRGVDLDIGITKLLVMLTIDVERETFEIKEGELSTATNFGDIHHQATDIDTTWDEKTVSEIRKHADPLIKDTDVGLCVDMPRKLCAKQLAIAPIHDKLGKKKGEMGVMVMPRPIQCHAKIGGADRRSISPHISGLGGKNVANCACWKGATASAVLRVLLCIVSYGDKKAKNAIWDRLHALDEYSQFLLVAYQFGFYQFNIGMKVLQLVRGFLMDDTTQRAGLDVFDKKPATLKHYYIAILALQDMLREITFKFTFDCETIGQNMVTNNKDKRRNLWFDYLKDATRSSKVDGSLAGMATLAPREEALFLTIVELYDMLVKQYPYLAIEWVKPSDQPNYDEDEDFDPVEAEREQAMTDAKNRANLFCNLFLMDDLPKMMQYIYYNEACMRHGWGKAKESRERRASIIFHILSIMSNMYLCNDMEKRYDILSMFYTFEAQEDPTLHTTRGQQGIAYSSGFMTDFLHLTTHNKYIMALTKYIHKNGWNVDRLGKKNPKEHVVECLWLYMKTSASGWKRVLLVATNRSVFRFDEPLGHPNYRGGFKNPPELMCPGGPEWAARYDYDRVREVIRGCDGCGFRLILFKDENRTQTLSENYVCYDHGALDRFLEVVLARCPSGGDYPQMVCDMWTTMYIKQYFPKKAAEEEEEEEEKRPRGMEGEKDPEEEIDVCISFDEVILRDVTYNHVMVVLSNQHRLYFYQKDYNYWMCTREDDNEFFLQKIPGMEEGLLVNSEWEIIPRSGIEQPGPRDSFPEGPSLSIHEKPGAGKGKGKGKGAQKRELGPLVLQAEFATYTACQTFWQAIRYAKDSVGGKLLGVGAAL